MKLTTYELGRILVEGTEPLAPYMKAIELRAAKEGLPVDAVLQAIIQTYLKGKKHE